MFPPPRLRVLILVAWLAVGVARLSAQGLHPGADQKWRHYQSEHFELYSRNPDGESRSLLYNLELVHAIFFESYGFTPVRALPITIYFFSRDKHFEAYKPAAYRKLENISTFYHGELDRGILTMAPLPTYEAAQQMAFGSYTHHLFRVMGEIPPVWYGYGMSGIFRNLVINDKKLELGRPDADQIERLKYARLLPVEVLFAADHKASSFQSDKGNSLFHDESWAVLHYLYFGAHKLPREGIATFARYIMANSQSFDAARTQRVFEQKVGISYGELNKEVEGYLRSGRYGYSTKPLPNVPPAKSYTGRSVSLEEINLRLAELAMRVNQSPVGKLTLLNVKEGNPEYARAREALGTDAAREGDWSQAGERWEEALAAGSANPAVMHELAQQEGRTRFQRFDLYYRLPDEAAGKLRDLLARSIATTPQQTAAYEVLAWVEATARDPKVANINLVQQSFPRLKARQRTLLALAMVRWRLNDKPGALVLLNELDKMDPDDWVRYGAEVTRATVEGRPVDRSKLPQAAAQGPAAVGMPSKIIKTSE